jgi:hypothetical protein
MGVWIVFSLDKRNGDILGVAGLYDNEPAARECESATVDVPANEYREVEHWGIQSAYKGESRMC